MRRCVGAEIVQHAIQMVLGSKLQCEVYIVYSRAQLFSQLLYLRPLKPYSEKACVGLGASLHTLLYSQFVQTAVEGTEYSHCVVITKSLHW